MIAIRLGEKVYGLEVTDVVEVVEPDQITRLYHLPPHVRGLMNLRNRIFPVSDLGILLGGSESGSDVGVLVRCESREAIFLVDEVLGIQEGAPIEVIGAEALFAESNWK